MTTKTKPNVKWPQGYCLDCKRTWPIRVAKPKKCAFCFKRNVIVKGVR